MRIALCKWLVYRLVKLPVACACALVFAGCGVPPRPAPVPDTVQTIGALQLVTRTTHVGRRSEGAWTVRESYSILHAGRPLELAGADGLYGDQTVPTTTLNAVFVLSSPVGLSDIVVNVGDANNASAFYLVRQQQGAIETSLICKALGGDNSVAWFDGPNARRGSKGLYVGPQNAQLDGGRMLALGSQCLYDVVSRRAYRLPGMRGDVSAWASVAPLGTSPDGRSIVRFGSRRIDGIDRMRVFIADLTNARWSELPVDPLRMRFPDHEFLDNAWLMHHFAWVVDTQGAYRLQERKNFAVLAFRGRLMSYSEYRIARWDPRHEEVLSAFLVRRMHAEALPSLASSTMTKRFMVDGLPIHVASAGFYVPSGSSSVEHASRLIRKVADLFDQELATGAYDAFFTSELE